MLIASSSSADGITGVTCDGIAMVRAEDAFWTTGEDASSYGYFLGSGIPAGEDLTIAITSSSGTYIATAITYTADGDTEVAGTGVLESDSFVDPVTTVTVDVGREVHLIGGANTGQNFVVFLAANAGYTNIHTHDFGTECAGIVIRDANDTGPGPGGVITFAPWTSPGEEIALTVLAIGEVPPPAPAPGLGVPGAVELQGFILPVRMVFPRESPYKVGGRR